MNLLLNEMVIPKKVLLAKDVVVTHEALVFERFVAVSTFEAFGMPVVVENFEDEPVEY